jgi:hypothetical protein
MKKKIPTPTAAQYRKLRAGQSIQLIKAPKGKKIFWYKDQIHYKFINA